MSSLTEFLLARVSEDEADEFGEVTPRHLDDCDHLIPPPGPFPCNCSGPARLLAECAAKRAIIALHHIQGYEDDDTNDVGLGCAECGHNEEYSDLGGWCDTVRLLAAVYADHPEYDPRWAQQ